MASPTTQRSAPTAGSKRFCGGPGCSRQISAVSFDPHTLCVQCQGLCEVDKRCDECREWNDSLVVKAYKHQLNLKAKRKYNEKRRGACKQTSSSSVVSHSSAVSRSAESEGMVVGAMAEGTVPSSPASSDMGPSASQLGDSSTVNKLETQLSNAMSFMSQMASFLGMSGDSTHANFREIVEEIVDNKLTGHTSISAPPLPAGVTSLVPLSTDTESFVQASLVGAEGEGWLAIGVTLDPPLGSRLLVRGLVMVLVPFLQGRRSGLKQSHMFAGREGIDHRVA